MASFRRPGAVGPITQSERLKKGTLGAMRCKSLLPNAKGDRFWTGMTYANAVGSYRSQATPPVVMRLKRKILVLGFAAVAIASSVVSAPGQQRRFGSAGERERDPGRGGRAHFDSQSLSRVLRNPTEAPEDLEEAVIAFRDSQRLIRDAWVNDFQPGPDASQSDWKAARAAFQEAYAEQMEMTKELKAALVSELQVRLRERIDESELSEEASSLRTELEQNQSQLTEAWREAKEDLGDDATREEIAAARKRFREVHQESITQQRELLKRLRDLGRASREVKDAAPLELQDLRRELMEERDQMRSRQRRGLEDLRNLNQAERQEFRRSLVLELRELKEKIKERPREGTGDGNGDQGSEG